MSCSRAFGTVLAVLCVLLISSTVHALANRVFVSARSGNDANTCTTSWRASLGNKLAESNLGGQTSGTITVIAPY